MRGTSYNTPFSNVVNCGVDALGGSTASAQGRAIQLRPGQSIRDQIGNFALTSEHREAGIERPPIAISAMGRNTLRNKQVVNIEDLAGKILNISFDHSLVKSMYISEL